jgi:hypothetical protein
MSVDRLGAAALMIGGDTLMRLVARICSIYKVDSIESAELASRIDPSSNGVACLGYWTIAFSPEGGTSVFAVMPL